ncbi:MAG: phytanoyl-CoA dioxygenase family protein [Gemmatimonadetes bacterium]|nr:phytanoyl-CoA dioxygenase family protein [Gemmatimonadota bacterium]MYF75004.1 phytanoyl-CoA dioxygenase family protein [Gemmatimonadota bacterium]MYK50258.1 phytanoyl-CoA dioxygenase family protein [Gemmatimonadota bacterium]
MATAETPIAIHDPSLYETTRRADYLDTLADIDDRQIARFHEQGYLAIQRAFTPQQIESAGQAMWDLIDGKSQDFKGIMAEAAKRGQFSELTGKARRDSVRKIWKFVDHDTRLNDLAHDPNILSVLSRMMDDTPVLFQDMGLIKPPHIGREKPWHQDCAYFNYPLGTTVVGVWIAIDAATEANGCLHIIPGSHREGPIPHFRRRDWQICDTDVAVPRNVTVPLDPGGCLFWHGMTHHGSPTNRSAHRRRALQYHYRPESTVEMTSKERLAIFGGDELGVTC